MTRRHVTALIGGAPLLAQVTPPTTQKAPPLGAPTPAPASATPEQKLLKAKEDVRQTSERLSKLEVAMDEEPAFAFRP